MNVPSPQMIQHGVLIRIHIVSYYIKTKVKARSYRVRLKTVIPWGGIHKPRGHGRGRGFAICPYFHISFIKWNGPQRGEGGKKVRISVHMVYEWPLRLSINHVDRFFFGNFDPHLRGHLYYIWPYKICIKAAYKNGSACKQFEKDAAVPSHSTIVISYVIN